MNDTESSSCGSAISEPAIAAITVAAFKSALAAAPALPLTVIWPDGEPIEPHFHVTEVGRVQRDFVDCGGTVRRLVTCLLQTWVGEDVDHRITGGKLLKAFEEAAPVLGAEDLPVELEYEACNVVQLIVASVKQEPERLVLQLASKHTDCLAKELCVPSADAGVRECCQTIRSSSSNSTGLAASKIETPQLQGMKLVQVYDPAMCCSTGVCGPDVDPALVIFAADLKWLQSRGVAVRRFGLAQSPAAFVENEKVREALTTVGEKALPLVMIGDTVFVSGRYPKRDELATQLGLVPVTPNLFTPAVAELVAVGAAIAANCEPCLRYHVNEAEKLGVTTADLNATITMAAKVKDAPHRNVMRLAARLTGEPVAPLPRSETDAGEATTATTAKSPCCS